MGEGNGLSRKTQRKLVNKTRTKTLAAEEWKYSVIILFFSKSMWSRPVDKKFFITKAYRSMFEKSGKHNEAFIRRMKCFDNFIIATALLAGLKALHTILSKYTPTWNNPGTDFSIHGRIKVSSFSSTLCKMLLSFILNSEWYQQQYQLFWYQQVKSRVKLGRTIPNGVLVPLVNRRWEVTAVT